MKSFKTYLLENNLSVLLEYKEWHQLIKQFGDKIIDQYELGYKSSTSEKDTIPHKTEFIKTQLGLHDIPKHHGRWILNQVVKGKIPRQEDISSTIIPNLAKFEEHKDRHRINLSKVNDRNELFNIVQKHAPEELDSFNLKHGEDYTLHGENEHWKVIQPHSQKAACSFGSNTNWCTASKSNSLFNFYNSQGPLHIIIPKKPLYKGEKYQYHASQDQFMNYKDIPVNSNRDELSFIDRPLPDINENLKFDLNIKTAFSNSSTKQKDQLDLIKHPKFGTDRFHIVRALQSPHEAVAKAAIEHPNFGIYQYNISRAIESPHESVAKAAIAHPKFGTDLSHILDAFRSSHESVAKAAIAHPKFGTDRYHIIKALESPHEIVAKAAMAHPKFGMSYIKNAIRSPHESVVKAAVSHPNFGMDPDDISTALQSPHEAVVKLGLKHPVFGIYPSHISIALRSPHESVVKAAIAHPKFGTDSSHITDTLESPHESVAKAALEHPKFGTDSSHFVKALKSPHESLVKAALEHPKFGINTSHILSSILSRNEAVAKAALEHPKFGMDISHIPAALSSPHESIRRAVLTRAKFKN